MPRTPPPLPGQNVHTMLVDLFFSTARARAREGERVDVKCTQRLIVAANADFRRRISCGDVELSAFFSPAPRIYSRRDRFCERRHATIEKIYPEIYEVGRPPRVGSSRYAKYKSGRGARTRARNPEFGEQNEINWLRLRELIRQQSKFDIMLRARRRQRLLYAS